MAVGVDGEEQRRWCEWRSKDVEITGAKQGSKQITAPCGCVTFELV